MEYYYGVYDGNTNQTRFRQKYKVEKNKKGRSYVPRPTREMWVPQQFKDYMNKQSTLWKQLNMTTECLFDHDYFFGYYTYDVNKDTKLTKILKETYVPIEYSIATDGDYIALSLVHPVDVFSKPEGRKQCEIKIQKYRGQHERSKNPLSFDEFPPYILHKKDIETIMHDKNFPQEE